MPYVPTSLQPAAVHFAASRPMIRYSAVFLTPESQAELLRQVEIPPGWTEYAHHCTVEYRPVGNRYPRGDTTLEVREIRQTDDLIYAVVNPPAAISAWARANNLSDIPWHVTIATATGVAPVKAKEATIQNAGCSLKTFAPPLLLSGEAGGFDGRRIVTRP